MHKLGKWPYSVYSVKCCFPRVMQGWRWSHDDVMPFIIFVEFVALFYYTLGNLEPHLRSSLHGIQLLSVLPSPLVEKYGIDTVLQPFMTAIQDLEKVNQTGRQNALNTISGCIHISVCSGLWCNLRRESTNSSPGQSHPVLFR